MNSLEQLIVLLPCHALEDFPTHHSGDHAASILANWTALWHPALIKKAGRIPRWISIDFPEGDLSNSLILVPTTCTSDIPHEVSDLAETGDSLLIAGEVDRDSIFARNELQALISPNLNSELVSDFLALGYAFLQIQLMTRQLRYSSSIDIEELQRRVVDAAEACCSGSTEAGKSLLANSFDLLLEEKNNYYPTEPKLLDLVLIARTTVNSRLENQLKREHPANLLLSGDLIELIRQSSPSSYEFILRSVAEKRLDICGVQQFEQQTQLVSIESVLNQIKLGIESASPLGKYPVAFASRCFSMSPQLPAILDQLNYNLVLHNTFCGGQLPHTASPVMNWQGTDGTNISAISTPPIDANQADGFLGLGVTIGAMLDKHHHCSLTFAHWPDQVSPWYEDLIRIGKYGPLLGRFHLLSNIAETIYDNGFSESFEAEDYQYRWLNSNVEDGVQNPISSMVSYWRTLYQIRSLRNALTMLAATGQQTNDYRNYFEKLDAFQLELEQAISSMNGTANQIAAQLDNWLNSQLPIQIFPKTGSTGINDEVTLLNPTGLPRTLEVADDAGASRALRAEQFQFARLVSFSDLISAKDPEVLVTDKDTGLPFLRNEFFSVQFDPVSGGVRSVNRLNKRGNFFSQQLSMRTSETVFKHGFPRQRFSYTHCQVDEIASAYRSRSSGSVKSVGRLLDSDADGAVRTMAEFEQIVTVARGSRRIEFESTIRPTKKLSGAAWNNYACSRIALPAEDVRMFRSENEIRVPVNKEKFIAPNFVEMVYPDSKLSLLTAGLSYHRKSAERILDTLLIVPGELETSFKFAIAVDAATSFLAVIDYLSPFYMLANSKTNAGSDGWIFHLNCKNVVVTNLQPKFNEAGVACGVQLRIHETEGRAGELTIRCPIGLKSARRTDFRGEPTVDLQVNDNCFSCRFCEFQYFQVECSW